MFKPEASSSIHKSLHETLAQDFNPVLLVHLLAASTRYANAAGKTSAPTPLGGLLPYQLRRVRQYIDEHLSEEIPLYRLARAIGMSEFYLARQFKESTGESLHQYLLKRRIEFAQRMLSEEDSPLIEVALRAGFKNQSHFTNRFRRFTGTTPRVFRAQRLATLPC